MATKTDNACLIGVDAGTTGLKSLAFDLSGKALCKAYREYPLYHPWPDQTEQNPEHWWDALRETIGELFEHGKIEPTLIAGLSISSQGSTFVALGADGQVLRPAISWLDRRAQDAQCEEEKLFAITGLRAFPGWTGSVLRWVARHEPETLRRARHLLLVGDYLIFRLTGVVGTEYSSASRTRMLDLEKRRWSEPILASLGVRESQLPPLGHSGEMLAGVSTEAARATGLLEGTPVVLGGFDQSCMAIGAGAITEKAMMVSLGTATMASVSSPRPVVDPQRRVITSCHALPDTWSLQAPIMTTGAILRWWRDHFFGSQGEDAYARMDRLAEKAPPGADGLVLLPHFSGSGAPHWDPNYRGALVGLTLAHTQSHVIRAILEGVAMEIASNLEVFESLGLDVKTVRIVGGGAVSNLWRVIIGDVLGKPRVRVEEVEVGTLGAAVLAGVGTSVFADAEEAVRRMVSSGPQEDYSEENHAIYQEVRRHYLEVSARLWNTPRTQQSKSNPESRKGV